jgi:nitrogen-specific signal transduction histidine kinase/ActR/RegA family two-component response regulator
VAAGEVLVVRDITAQRDLEAQVRQAQKVDAIGQLAGGVAHDFNNMLTPILAYAELIREADGATEEVRAFAGTVAETAARAAALTRQLLAFSRKGAQEKRLVDLDRLAEETLALLRRTLDRRIEVVSELRARTPVLADAALVQNALLNLALNARDAMPAGGTLRVAARRVEVAPEDCRLPGFTLSPGPHVELTVSDTGQGMTPEVQARLFEPFFTTKEVGKGTGLGLPAVHGTVTEHGGAVVVASAPGSGTTFRLLLPAAGAGVEPAARPARRAPRLTGRVLVVEDEAAVRAVVVHQLRAMGLECVVASDGEEGLAGAAAAAGLRLAVLDLVLPRRHGREVLARLRAAAPDLPVLLCSGYDRDADLPALLALPRVALLAKPFRPSELAEAVVRLLGDGPSPPAPPSG